MSSDTSVVFNLLAKDKATQVVKSVAKKIGQAAGVAGAAGATALAAGMVGNLENEAVGDKVAASLGLTPDQQKVSGAAASKVFAGAYADNMGEASDAVGTVMSSLDGMRTASAQVLGDTTIMAQNYAHTFDTDVSEAVSSVGVLMKTGLAKDATEGFDLLTAASQKVPKAMRSDMLEASNEYAKHLAGLGYSGQEAFGILATAAQGGSIALDKTGDVLKEFQLRSSDMSTGTKAAYKAVGLNAHTMANDILAGGAKAKGATAEIASRLLAIKDPAKQAQTAISLFGTPLEDLGVDQIPAFLQSLSGTAPALANVDGAAKRMGDTLNDNGKARVDAMRNSVTLWTQSLTQSDGALGTASAGVAAFGGDVVGMGSQLGVMAMALKGTTVLTTLWSAASSVASVAMTGVGIAVRFALGPVGLIIIGLTLLVAGLIYAYKHSEKFRAVVHGAMHGAGAAFKWLMGKAQAVFGWLRSNWPIIRTILIGPIGAAVLYIHRNFDKIVGFVRGMKSKISGAARGMWGGITSAFRGAINAIIGGWNRLSFGIPGFNAGPIHYGGFQMHPPSIPYMARGGVVSSPTLAMIGEGGQKEAVVPLDRAREFGFGGGGGPVVLQVERGGGTRFEAMMVEMIREFVRVKGRGNVQTALGKA